MGKIKQTLTNLIFWLAIIVSCYFIEGIGLLSEQPFSGFDNVSYISILCLTLILISTYLVFEHKLNRLKADFVLLPILLILFIVFTWTIWNQQEVITISNVTTGFVSRVLITKTDKFKYTLELGVSLIVLYLVLFVFSRQKVRNRQMMWLPSIYIGITFVSCLGTFITDWDKYVGLVTNGSLVDGISFWYYNENLFGYVLLIGILCCFVVNTTKIRWWSFIFMFIFFVQVILTTCATSMILSTAAILLYILFEIFCGFKKKPYLSMTFMIMFITLITSGLITCYILQSNGNKFIVKIFDYLNDSFSNKDFSTLSGRRIVWHNALDLISDSKRHLWFGRGYGTSTKLLQGYTAAIESGAYISSTHSAYIEILYRHGLLGLILYIIAFVYFLAAIIHLIVKKHFRFAMIYLICVAFICMQGVMESDLFFTSNVTGLVQTIIFVMPVFRTHKNIIHKKAIDSLEEFDFNEKRIDYHQVSYSISTVLMTLIFGVITLMSCSVIYLNNSLLPIIGSGSVILIILLLFYPYFVSMLYRRAKKHKFVFRLVYTSVFIFILPIASLVACATIPSLESGLIALPAFLMLSSFIFLYMLFIPRNGSLIEWIKMTFHGIAITSKWGILASTIGLFAFVMLQSKISFNPHSMLVFVVINMVIFLFAFVLVPSNDKSAIINEYNSMNIQRIKTTLKKDRI